MANNSIPISDIKEGKSISEQIKVRIMRMWFRKSNDEKNVEAVELILIDANGDAIQATVKKPLVKHYLEMLNEGDTYKIRKFSSSSNRLGFDMATFHQCKIWFEYSTRVVQCEIADIPPYVHAFYTFREFYVGAMPDKLYVAVIGRLEHAFPPKVGDKGQKRRSITLGNSQNEQLCCTLFGKYSDQISEIADRFEGKPKPTLVMLYIKRSVYDGEVSICTTWGATQILVNPDMIQVHEFNKSFKDSGDEQNILGNAASSGHHPAILASANIKSLDEIEKLTKGGAYVTMATFVELDTSSTAGWFYNSCNECKAKVHQREDGLWYCDKEKKKKKTCSLKGVGIDTPTPRFQVKFFVTNDTANLCEFIVWDEAMTELLGTTAQKILDDDEIYNLIPPPHFRPLIEREFIVKIRVDQDFNIEQKSSTYGVISLSDDTRTIQKWKTMNAANKEQGMSTTSSSTKDTSNTDSMMEIMREKNDDEPMTESEEATPQKGIEGEADTSDKFSAKKLQEIRIGKLPMCPSD